jgi:hypothetical protein
MISSLILLALHATGFCVTAVTVILWDFVIVLLPMDLLLQATLSNFLLVNNDALGSGLLSKFCLQSPNT